VSAIEKLETDANHETKHPLKSDDTKEKILSTI